MLCLWVTLLLQSVWLTPWIARCESLLVFLNMGGALDFFLSQIGKYFFFFLNQDTELWLVAGLLLSSNCAEGSFQFHQQK